MGGVLFGTALKLAPEPGRAAMVGKHNRTHFRITGTLNGKTVVPARVANHPDIP